MRYTHRKKLGLLLLSTLFINLFFAAQVFAADGDVGKVQNFMKDVVNMFTLIAGSVAALFIVFGGYKYITSGGDTQRLDEAKKTLLYAGVGLAIVLAANVIGNIVYQIATKHFQ